MKIKIVSQKNNPLLKRKEVKFIVEPEEKGLMPSRYQIREQLSSLLKADLQSVYVEKVQTKTGTMVAYGEANAYDSIEQAKQVEAKHIIARNAPPKKQKEQG